jgi:DNA-directed RNA polymerase
MQGTSYVSHIAVGLDGSCNGLQNFSAMLRDEVGGAATNLVPSEKPADIYSEVARVATEMVARDVAAGVEYADLWVGKVNRKIAKRPSMTLSYGATQYGFGDQLRDTVRKIEEETGTKYLGDGTKTFQACVYMAKVLYEAIGDVVVAARKAMGWLQAVAKVVASNGLPIRWETPAGLMVSQNYRKDIGTVVKVTVAGVLTKLTLMVDGSEVDVRRNSAGISPNYIHSLDASHMMLTINKCMEAGITEFAMVHDSYGTHACNAGHLGAHLREAFIEQYSGNVLEDFRNQLMEQLPEELHQELPPVPAMGNLDLNLIRESDYFFA